MTPSAPTAHDFFLVACAGGTVLLLLLLITRIRLHPALSLASAAMMLGLASGMPLHQIPLSFTSGVGNLMGHIAIVLGLGAVLGRLLATSGGATALGGALVEISGEKGILWAMLGMGILVGMPVFFEVGLVLLMPIVAEAARRSGKPAILLGVPLMAGLSMVHAVLPPHPAAMLAVTQYHADLGRTIFYGFFAGLPAAILAGPVLAWLLMRVWKQNESKDPAEPDDTAPLFAEPALNRQQPDEGLPAPAGAMRAAAAILLPVALIFLGSWADALTPAGSLANQILHFTGAAEVALLIAVLVALVTLGGRIQAGQHHGRNLLRQLTSDSFAPIADVLVILAAAGGLSGILRDSGAAQATVALALGAAISPLVLAWLLAAVVRIAMGSSTVAMAVASGILAPMAGHLGVRPELLVLATGTGSVILSHVNDPGFWMIQSFFKLEVKETLATWSLLETVLSIAGLGTTLALSAILG